jgi:hypothetical protein
VVERKEKSGRFGLRASVASMSGAPIACIDAEARLLVVDMEKA